MSYKNVDIVNFDGFNAQYMNTNREAFVFQTNAIQIYPLSIASLLIQAPTPLFRAKYNFLLLFSAGGGTQQIDNEIFELTANDVLFIREGHLNAIKCIDPTTDGYYIYIDSTLLPQIFVDSALLHRFTFHPKCAISKSEMDWLCKCCDLIFSQSRDTMYFKETQSTLLKAIILKLAESSATTLSNPDRQSEITMLFKELLYKHFIKHKDVKFYANLLAVSENYLNRCVNYITRKSPKQHINEMVIVHSKLLLQDYSKDISQVAFDLNFSDLSYFGRFFKQLTGQTPTDYRNSVTQGLSE